MSGLRTKRIPEVRINISDVNYMYYIICNEYRALRDVLDGRGGERNHFCLIKIIQRFAMNTFYTFLEIFVPLRRPFCAFIFSFDSILENIMKSTILHTGYGQTDINDFTLIHYFETLILQSKSSKFLPICNFSKPFTLYRKKHILRKQQFCNKVINILTSVFG